MNAPITQAESMALAPVTSASAGALLLNEASMVRLERIADLMASGKTTIPQHLRGSKGDCFAITLQSMQWGMNPFAVAQKTHLVNGVLGYEAQLVAAVINSSGAVRDRFHFEWFGPWEKIIGKFKEVESKTKKDDNGHFKKYIVPAWQQSDEHGLGVRVWATLKGEQEPRVLELLLTQARTRNSTLWTEDPKQQLAYLAQKRWSRLYAPDVILGVYTPDELAEPTEQFMGAAEVVQTGAGQQPAAGTASEVVVTTWPADLFKQRLPEWHKAIQQKKATADQIILKARTKHALTPEQEEAIRKVPTAEAQAAAPAADVSDATPKAAPAAAPTVTYAQVADAINKASDFDVLAEAGDLIGAVADPQQRAELKALYDKREAEIAG